MAAGKRQASKPVERTPPKKLTYKEKKAAKSAINKAAHLARKNAARAHELSKHPALIKTPSGMAKVIGDNKPIEYDPLIAEQICVRFSSDPFMSLQVLNATPEYPTVWTFYKWLKEQPECKKMYDIAREIWCDLRAGLIVQTSLEPLIGEERTTIIGGKDDGQVRVKRYDNVARAALVVDTQKWCLSKEMPRKYGVQPLSVEDGSPLQDLLNQFRNRSKELENGGA